VGTRPWPHTSAREPQTALFGENYDERVSLGAS
jgi:hypothetical protein